MTDKDFVLSIHPDAFEYDRDDCDNINGVYFILVPHIPTDSVCQAWPLGWHRKNKALAWKAAAESIRAGMIKKLEQ